MDKDRPRWRAGAADVAYQGLRSAYWALALSIIFVALAILALETLHQLNYNRFILSFTQRYAPNLEIKAVRMDWSRKALRVRVETLHAPAFDARAKTLNVSIGWPALFRLLAGEQDVFANAAVSVNGLSLRLRQQGSAWSLGKLTSTGRATTPGLAAALTNIPSMLIRNGRHLKSMHAQNIHLELELASGERMNVDIAEAWLWRDADEHWQLKGELRIDGSAEPTQVRLALDTDQRRVRLLVHRLYWPALGWASEDERWRIGVDEADFSLQAWMLSNGNWVAELDHLRMVRSGNAIELRHVLLRRNSEQVSVVVPMVDVGSLRDIALASPWMPAKLGAIFAEIQPNGLAFNVKCQLPLNGKLADSRLRADLIDLQLSPWLHVPGISGMRGSVEMGLRDGSAVFHMQDGSLSLPKIYEQPLRGFQRVSGGLRWQITDDARLLMAVDPVNVVESGGETGRALVWIDAGWQAEREPVTVNLMVGWRDTDLSVGKKYLPRLLGLELREWLDETLLDGHVRSGGLIYRATMSPEHEDSNTLQLYSDGDKFRVNWSDALPKMTDWQARVTLDDTHALFDSQHAMMAGDSWYVDGPVHGHADIIVSQAQGTELWAATAEYGVRAQAHNMTLHVPAIDEALANMSLEITGAADEWTIFVRHPQAKARITVPLDAAAPTLVEIRRLSLPKLSSSATAQSAPPDIHGWPMLDVDIGEFTLGKYAIGPAYFQLRSGPDRLSVRNLNVTMGGMTLRGQENPFGDHITWIRQGDIGDHTAMAFALETNNLTSALRAFDLQHYLAGGRASVSGSLAWNAHPLGFTLAQLNGGLRFDVETGKLRSDRSSRNLVRAIAVLDLDQWVKKSLSREFVRYASDGILFNRLHGELSLRNGRLITQTPINMNSPSTDLLLNGNMDLVNQQLKGQLIVGFPASRNVGWLALLSGVNPVTSIAVLAAGQLFGRWIDNLASISYHIDGTWEEPKISLDQVFNRGQSR